MTKQVAVPLTILVVFSAFSTWLVAGEHPLGFLINARDNPWGMQVLLDLVIACSLFVGFMRRDARQRGLPFLPYLVGILLVGSIGALAYLVHRGLAAATPAAATPAGAIAKSHVAGALQ